MVCPSDLVFDPEYHRYLLGGVPIPHVTEIVQATYGTPPVSRDRLDELAALGRAAHDGIHKVCKAFLETKEWPRVSECGLTGAGATAVERFLDVVDYLDWRPLDTEVMIANRELWYAGRLDLLAIDRVSRRILIDFKSGSSYSKAHEAQLGGYLLALESIGEESSVEEAGLLYLRIREDARAKWRVVNIEEAIKEFLACLDDWRLDQAECDEGGNHGRQNSRPETVEGLHR